MSVLSPLGPIFATPALLLSALLMVLLGAHGASMLPYVSAIGVHVFGLSDGQYAWVLVVSSLVSVGSSVAFGIHADRWADRRGVALVTVVFLTLGSALVWLLPKTGWFVLAHAALLPLSSALFGHVFALARLASGDVDEAHRASVMTVLRALFALPWVLVLPFWALAIKAGVGLTAIYPFCTLLAVAALALIWRYWPKDGHTPWADPPSGLSLRAALSEIGDRGVLLRVAALGGVNVTTGLYIVLVGLIFAQIPDRGDGATALYAGLMAGFEVPFMMALVFVIGRIPAARLIWLGAALYCIHLGLLPFLAHTPWVWALTVAGAAGGAIVITQPMAYLQELLGNRPGAGASLMALQKLVGDGLSAVVFALGTAVGGYAGAALLGVAVILVSGGALVWMDRRAR